MNEYAKNMIKLTTVTCVIKRIENKYSLQELYDNSNLYTKMVMNLRDDKKFYDFYQTLKMSRYEPSLAVDLPISGEFVFNCDRRIWQSLVFDKIAYNVDYGEDKIIKPQKIERYLKYHQSYVTVNEEYANTQELIVNGKIVKIDLVHNVVKKYLEYLVTLRCIYKGITGQLYQRLRIKTVDNSEKSYIAFSEAFRHINGISFDIDNIIEKEIYNTEKSYLNDIYTVIDEETIQINKYHKIVPAHCSDRLHDRYYNLWYKCLKCGEIKRDYEFQSVITPGRLCGICKDCS